MQLTLYHAMPGYLGGCALRDAKGIAYLREIAAKGGRSTVDRYGRDYMRKIALASVASRKQKRENDPRTIKNWDGQVMRIIPRKKTGSKRKKPEYVQVLLDEGKALQ